MNKVSFISKLYVWSVVLEPLLFFILWDEWTTGIGGNLSRILQAIVVMLLLLKFLIKPFTWRMINFAHPLYRNFSIYFGIAILAGLIGVARGAYDVYVTYSTIDFQSYFARHLNSTIIRPFFEYAIILYYFIYFVVMARYMLKTKEAVLWFFSVFKKVFVVSLALGFIDVFLNFIPRHLADGVLVGEHRFHGLAGEPRHAFVYLFLGLAVFNLEAHLKGRALNKFLAFAIIVAAFLTQTTSGLVGIAVFLVLFSADRLMNLVNRRQFYLTLVVIGLTAVVAYVSMITSDRFLQYVKSASNLWFLLETRSALPYLMSVQSNDIYPLYDFIVKARDLNLLPVMIGSGLGSASVINNFYMSSAVGQAINPNSQLTRTLFESGIVGTFFFISSFIYPVKLLTKQISGKDRFIFISLTWLLIGCFMGVRSSVLFIYLGIFFAVFVPFYEKNKGREA